MPTSVARPLSTRQLLVAAVACLLVMAGSVGTYVLWETRAIHEQTRQLLDNAVPSAITAAHFLELVSDFELPPPDKPLIHPASPERWQATMQQFRLLIAREMQLGQAYSGERTLLLKISQQLNRMDTTYRAWQAAQDAEQARFGRDLQRAAVELGRACRAFRRINDQGMLLAEAAVFEAATSQEQLLVIGMVAIAGSGLLIALLIAWSIAAPLASLQVAAKALPASDDLPWRLPGWAPRELHELQAQFTTAAATIHSESRRRQAAQAALKDALGRELELNRHLADINASLDSQVQAKTAALAQANAQLAAAIEGLQARDRSKSAFLAAISHELRGPLAVIHGAVKTLQSLKGRLDDQAADRLLGSAADEAVHLTSLVDDLLDAARLDAGTFRIEKEPEVAVDALLRDVAASLQRSFDDHGVRLAVADVPVPPTAADPRRLRQVLRNLLENAAKYAPLGSEVVAAVSVEPAVGQATHLLVTVTDAGEAITADEAELLFAPFVRGVDRMGAGGTGLGLAIARQLVEAHDGEIGVSTGFGGGNRFWLRLPLTQSVTS